MDLTEKCLESREIYKGRILRLRVDTVALPNGKTSLREIVEHPGGVGILALWGTLPAPTCHRRQPVRLFPAMVPRYRCGSCRIRKSA